MRLPSVTCSSSPGATSSCVADVDALGLEDVADGVAEGRDLLLLPVDREGHGGGQRGVAVGAAGDSEDHRRHEGAEKGLAADEGVETVMHTAPNVVLSGSRATHHTPRSSGEVCAGPTPKAPHTRRSARAPVGDLVPIPANSHKTITVFGGSANSNDQSEANSSRLPGPSEGRARCWRRRPGRASPGPRRSTSAMARTVCGTRYDALGRPRYGTGVRKGASVSTSTRSSGVTASALRSGAAFLKVTVPAKRQVGAALEARPREAVVAGEAVHHPALRARPRRR